MSGVLLWLIFGVVLLMAILLFASLVSGGAELERLGRELRAGREEARTASRELRQEVVSSLQTLQRGLLDLAASTQRAQTTQLEQMTGEISRLTQSNQEALERIRATFDGRVKELQQSNEKKLEEMRQTVDEKLHATLERRLSESFKVVSERLEAVHQGLGEMQNLAADVGDLKRVLSNVKARGTFGEVQLGAILEQILTTGQYEKNVRVNPNSQERVEYAIRLPGPEGDLEAGVWLPIDAKFPQEDYQRLLEAVDQGDAEGARDAAESLERAVRMAAKIVHDKYIVPPHTTDFAMIFLPSEGLYAEVLRRPGLVEELMQLYRVVVAGPNNMAAILNAMRMGFQTLAIERRATEVWRVLGAVKTEFGKFGEAIAKVRRHLDHASKSLDETGRRTRAMERRLRAVEALPETEAADLLALPPSVEAVED